MELRVLQYFLAVTREQNITAAAESLHLSQPTLSRQIMDMEKDLGKKLFVRASKGSKRLILTNEGMILKKRAEEIMTLVDKAEREINASDEAIAGEISIGAAELESFQVIADAAKKLHDKYPNVHYDIFSNSREYVLEKLEDGLIDFGFILGDVDDTKYNSIRLPITDKWCVIMRKDSPLAERKFVEPKDLWDKPLIISKRGVIANWIKRDVRQLHIVAENNLMYNAALMVKSGMGYNISLLEYKEDDELCSKPLYPEIDMKLFLAWKKHQPLSRACEKFLEYVKTEIEYLYSK